MPGAKVGHGIQLQSSDCKLIHRSPSEVIDDSNRSIDNVGPLQLNLIEPLQLELQKDIILNGLHSILIE